MGKVNNFDVLKAMGERNLDIRGFGGDNIKSTQIGKDGWGEIRIAINNETVMDMAHGKNLIVYLVVADAKQFNETKKSLEA